jgi:hypothetical protein
MNDQRQKLIAAQVAELKGLFGPPPVLRTEDANAYEEVVAQFLENFSPQDFLEKIFIKDLANATWDITRYTRQKTLTVEQKVQQRFERQVQQTVGPAMSASHVSDAILKRPPSELDHAWALEIAIDYVEQLDNLLNGAVRRRNDALEQFERYRAGLGAQLRRVSDAIILHESGGSEARADHESPSLSPQPEHHGDL